MKRFELPAVPTEPTLPRVDDGHEALVKLGPELAAVDPAIVSVNLNIPRACAIALAALPSIRKLRPRIVAELPALPVADVDALEDRALALYYAHALCGPRKRSDEELAALCAEGRALRADLLDTATLLARRSLLESAKVAEIRGGFGTLDLANDLTALSLLFRTNWAAVAAKIPISQSEVERADVVGRAIIVRHGSRLHSGPDGMTEEETRDQRARCFALFVASYDLCRKAAAYFCWETGDSDRLVPPLHPRRSRAGRADPTSSP